MLFKNISNGVEVNVSNLKMREGRIFFTVRNKPCGQKFLTRNTCLVLDEHVEDGTYLKIAEGWELAKPAKPAKGATPKKAASEPQPATPAATNNAANEPASPAEPASAPTPAPATPARQPKKATTPASPASPSEITNEELQLLLSLKRMRGSNVDREAVRQIVEEVIENLASQPAAAPKLAAATKAIKANKAKGAKVYKCKDFDDIKSDVEDGFYPYLVGAAGCGKSHTAEQIAEELGLTLYTQTTIQFAHDVKGYGDANGKLVETPFYKAFAFGGLYFQDEYDRSFTEAAVVLNTALANKYYDFPVIGRVEAHPNFRFMAAGNTNMRGANGQYTAAQPIDLSSVDRVIFYQCTYNHEVELNAIAKGDKELVSFVEDVRRAVAKCGLDHIVSYRATAYMKSRENKKEKALLRATFKSLEVDEIRLIWGALSNKDNVWAKAMENII